MALTSEQIEFYREKGYLGVEGVLTPAQVAEGQRIVDELVERSRDVTEHTDVYDLEPGHTAASPKVRRLKNPVGTHPYFDALMRSDAILDLVADLIGPGVRFQGNKLNMKSAAFGSPVEWHQDVAFYPHTNDDLLAVGVALDDSTTENGCLLVIPGSHRGPVLDHHQDGYFVGAIAPSRAEVDLGRAVPIEVPAGGVSIHHVCTLHGSTTNRSSRPRRLLLYQYAAVDAFPLAGVADLDAFNRNIVRGEATCRFRRAAGDVRVWLPRPERDGSIYELQTNVKETVFAGPAMR